MRLRMVRMLVVQVLVRCCRYLLINRLKVSSFYSENRYSQGARVDCMILYLINLYSDIFAQSF